MSALCPGYAESAVKDMDADDSVRLMCEGTASQYHLHPEMPHLFCGCGNEAAVCHPGRCCKDDDWGQCTNCHRPAPDPDPPTEAELSDGLWASTTPLPPAGGDAP